MKLVVTAGNPVHGGYTLSRVDGRIILVEPGPSMNVELLLDVDGEHLRARITRDALKELDLSVGREVFALVKSVALESSLGS